jgi:hypothetical protein
MNEYFIYFFFIFQNHKNNNNTHIGIFTHLLEIMQKYKHTHIHTHTKYTKKHAKLIITFFKNFLICIDVILNVN